jgi:pimeloyl-ACP methyl ester carboxylesterase
MEYARTIIRDDGTAVAYRLMPARERAPGRIVVLVHGLASNMTRWSEFVEQTTLADRWDVLRVDLRGHGDSPTRGAIGHELWCDDLAAILDAEGHPRAVLVGHSLGAQVALHFAVRHAARAAALGLIDPVFREALRGKWRLLAAAGPALWAAAVVVRALNAIGLRRRQLPRLDLRALDEMARRALGSKEAEAEFIRRYSSTRADLRTFRTAHYLQELVEMFRPVPLEAIAVPVLVLLSAGGTFADPDAMQRCLRRLPRVEVQRIDCHHWPLTERPVEVRHAIEDWCARLEPALTRDATGAGADRTSNAAPARRDR